MNLMGQRASSFAVLFYVLFLHPITYASNFMIYDLLYRSTTVHKVNLPWFTKCNNDYKVFTSFDMDGFTGLIFRGFKKAESECCGSFALTSCILHHLTPSLSGLIFPSINNPNKCNKTICEDATQCFSKLICF